MFGFFKSTPQEPPIYEQINMDYVIYYNLDKKEFGVYEYSELPLDNKIVILCHGSLDELDCAQQVELLEKVFQMGRDSAPVSLANHKIST